LKKKTQQIYNIDSVIYNIDSVVVALIRIKGNSLVKEQKNSNLLKSESDETLPLLGCLGNFDDAVCGGG